MRNDSLFARLVLVRWGCSGTRLGSEHRCPDPVSIAPSYESHSGEPLAGALASGSLDSWRFGPSAAPFGRILGGPNVHLDARLAKSGFCGADSDRHSWPADPRAITVAPRSS